MSGDVRTRILAASVVCVGRTGLSKTSLDEVAREAGVGRATVYRHFPGGRDELISQTIAWEVVQFFQRLAVEVDGLVDLADRLEVGLLFAHRELVEHEVFQKVLETEPERLLPHLSTSGPLIVAALSAYVTPLLRLEDLAPGTTVDDTADFLARMVLSFIVGQGRWDFDDPSQIRELVQEHLLSGVLAGPTG